MSAGKNRTLLSSIPEDTQLAFERDDRRVKVYRLSPRNWAVPKLPAIGPSLGHLTQCYLSPVQEDELTVAIRPIVKFRRMARAVLMLIQVCNACSDTMMTGVRSEPWYALLDNLVATSNLKQKRKGPRPFVTFVPNEKRELVQLTFDLSEFKKDRRSEFILTDEVRDILSILPNRRPPDQIAKVIRCMKGLFDEFSNYPLSVQKQICQRAFYDKYQHNRVIVKKGQSPDGIYFVLSGLLIEKHEVGRQPKEIQTGATFGEYDLVCGSMRRHTVLTRTDTELLYLHRQDYRVIFNMAEDSHDPKNLDICKQHIIFQHFPMVRLADNPGTWSVVRYKYGRLIAKDSNDVDWIYVIKSGEARVFKYLEPGNIDVQARRKKVQAMINAQSTFYKKKKILSFVEAREYIRSSYSPRRYQPTIRSTMSAPPGALRARMSLDANRRGVSTCIPGPRPGRSNRNRVISLGSVDRNNKVGSNGDSKRASIVSRKSEDGQEESQASINDGDRKESVSLPRLKLDVSDDESMAEKDKKSNTDNENPTENEQSKISESQELETIKDISSLVRDGTNADTHGNKSSTSLDRPRTTNRRASFAQNAGETSPRRLSAAQIKDRARSGSFIKTPCSGRTHTLISQKSTTPQVIQVGNHTLPAFVQIETLHPGQAFGLRACLDSEERGPSVSLVSGECEILQINKKFFMKHCDDAIYSLIRLKAKPFPSQEDLIDRLDANMQWEEYKQKTLKEFLQKCRRFER